MVLYYSSSLENSKSRNKELQKYKANAFEDALDNLSDICHANAMNLIMMKLKVFKASKKKRISICF